MKILYFAWVRQKAGVAQEEIDIPDTVATVGELIDWMRSRDPRFEQAFEDIRAIRAAVDQVHAQLDTPIADAGEIAFFPPVTGG